MQQIPSLAAAYKAVNQEQRSSEQQTGKMTEGLLVPHMPMMSIMNILRNKMTVVPRMRMKRATKLK